MASSIGTPGSSIRFADLNGDGRAEYLSVAEDGAVTEFLNGGYKFLKDGQGEIAWISQGISIRCRRGRKPSLQTSMAMVEQTI